MIQNNIFTDSSEKTLITSTFMHDMLLVGKNDSTF